MSPQVQDIVETDWKRGYGVEQFLRSISLLAVVRPHRLHSSNRRLPVSVSLRRATLSLPGVRSTETVHVLCIDILRVRNVLSAR